MTTSWIDRWTYMAASAALIATLALGGGCFSDTSVHCADSTRCPAGLVCEQRDGVAMCMEPGACGDGDVQTSRGEVCDDGNTQAGDGCSADCLVESCGNDIVDDGEVCDDGNNVSGDGCSADCRSNELCGNGIVDVGEACDCGTGEVVPTSASCAGRQNASTGGHCSDTCGLHCGDGVMVAEEACDVAMPITSASCIDLRHDFGRPACSTGCGDVTAGPCGDLGWRAMPPVTSAWLYDVWGSGPDHAFAVGDNGTVLHYDGTAWHDISPPTSALLYGVWGSGPNDVFAVGDSGTVLHYDGISWLPIQSGTLEYLYGVWGDPTGQQVFTVGSSGAIYRLHRTARGRRGIIQTAGPGLALSIPDDRYDGALASMACVDLWAPAVPLGQVVLELGVEHSRIGDLTVKLDSPLGTVTTLLSRPGHAETGDDGHGEGGTEAAVSADAPITFHITGAIDAETMGQAGGVICANDGQCSFAPNPGAGPGTGLSDFDNQNVAGRWRVCVGDSRTGATGYIDSIKLTLDGRCGNGKHEVDEQCDDGNLAGGDGCNADCRFECGDGVVQPGEQCDDGARFNNDGCSWVCAIEFCGDGIVNNREECDDGNTDDLDGCSATCIVERCGDGVQQSAEQCDDGNTDSNDGCSDMCVIEFCGDGIVNNGIETCDDGNTEDNDGCSATCIIECGDGVLQPDEQCDDGNAASDDGCSDLCVIEFCGDGTINNGVEECDDSNTTDNDGCSASCLFEPVSLNDDFETYSVGDFLGLVSPHWTTWSGYLGGAEDVQVVDDNANSGRQSIYLSSTDPGGGPQDLVFLLPFDYTTGHASLSMSLFVESGKGGYFNVQASRIVDTGWTLDILWDELNNMSFSFYNTATNSWEHLLATTYISDSWFELTLDIDLDTNTWEVFIDQISQGSFVNVTPALIGAVDFYPANFTGNDIAGYWVDDVRFSFVP